ncbi:uncharacterized protein V6R79_017061 [Siganus canaliculatus]
MKMNSGSNQRTLFQSWGGSVSQNKVVQPRKDSKKAAGRRRTTPSNTTQVAKTNLLQNPLWPEIGQGSTCTSDNIVRTKDCQPAFEDEDDDDDLMVVAVYEAEKSLQLDNANSFQHDNRMETESATSSSIPSSGQTYPDFPGFDSSSAKVWIYPTNYPIREYQLKMSEAALFQNTLVCLPTGLGKTFIASVVMYNFYRWYPSGKIVFMAPTKPLVAQQIEACYKVMGIPQAHMAELTGSTAAKQRQEIWRSKRVFFLTPQVMVNDLSRQTCPAQQVKCVVIDEAHKALGNHAYCQVIRQLGCQTQQFRILALSATPGGDAKSVQSVISNLLISHIELRSDESPDIQAHSHQRSVEKVVVPLGEALSIHQASYLQVLEKFTSRLVQNRVMVHKDLRSLSKYQLILARDQFRKNPPPHIKGTQQGVLEGDFALCISLYHGYELLMQMGLRSLFFYIQGIMDGSREMSRARHELQRTPMFMDLYHEMEAMFVKQAAGPDETFIYSHPKLKKLEEVVLQHFRLWAENARDNNGKDLQEVSTRVMIFSSFRESVQEIAAMLNRHAALIRVMTFMGQASAGKGVKGFTQKEQLEVVHRFRQGGFNTLVSTCVGEEGLDIGEVDLIVCFDAQKNPIRLVQRMGRTGRKRQGRIVVILAEGREERTYNQSQSNKRSVYKSIIGNKSGFHLYPNSPRMLPEGVNPTIHKMHITCGQFDHGDSSRRSIRGRRSHGDGQTSLIHPQNLIQPCSTTSDGFLSSTEYSLWASTIRLRDDETHPTLKQSHFMSLCSDPPHQKELSKNQGPLSKELSLSEWRHWQHKTLPTHLVDHSLRCQHFIKVMELIDGMREENEGECRYEEELLPYLHKADGHIRDKEKRHKATKAAAKTTNRNLKSSRFASFDRVWVDDEAESSSAMTEHTFPIPNDTEASYDDITDQPGPEEIYPNPEAHMDVDCVAVHAEVRKSDHAMNESLHLEKKSQLHTHYDEDKDAELQAMFYLPEWGSAAPPSTTKLCLKRDESLRIVLADVAELLSRSPPSLTDDFDVQVTAPSLPPSPQNAQQPFQVSFTLNVDDDDDDDDGDNEAGKISDEYQPNVSRGTEEPNSPSWDEVFGEEEVDDARQNDVVETRNEVEQVMIEVKSMKGSVTEGEQSYCSDVRNMDVPVLEDCGVTDEVRTEMDDSIDLFGDDEAFLQMTIPDISTPGVTPKTSPSANAAQKTLNTSHMHTPAKTGSAHKPNTLQKNDFLYTDRKTPSAHAKLLPQDTNTQSAADPKPNIDTIAPEDLVTPQWKSSTVQQNSDVFDNSQDFFSVNFNLGYSLDDSDEETKDAPAHCTLTSSQPEKQTVSTSSTPYSSAHKPRFSVEASKSKLSSPQMLSEHRKREMSSPLASPWICKGGTLPSPITSPRSRLTVTPGHTGLGTPSLLSRLKRRRLGGGTPGPERAPRVENSFCQQSVFVGDSLPHPVECDSEEEVVGHKRRPNMVNPLSSPEVSKISSDVESPLVVKRKRTVALNMSEEMEGGDVSDDDFQNVSVFTHRTTAAQRQQVQPGKAKVCVETGGSAGAMRRDVNINYMIRFS